MYCLKCRKNTENRNQKVVRTRNRIIMLNYQNVKCAIVKNQNISISKKLADYLGSLEIKTSLSKIPLACPLLF